MSWEMAGGLEYLKAVLSALEYFDPHSLHLPLGLHDDVLLEAISTDDADI